MKQYRTIILILVGLMGAYLLYEIVKPQKTDWSQSFSRHHKKPFGNYALYQTLDDLFTEHRLITSYEPIYNTLADSSDNRRNYLWINYQCRMNKQDAETLLKFVERGNIAFLAANFFKGQLADSLKFATSPQFHFSTDTVVMNFTNPQIQQQGGYRYRAGWINQYFTTFDTSRTTVLGQTLKDRVNFIRIRFGEGAFYISSVPVAFTNYNLLHGPTEYISKALSYLPERDVVWDEFYKVGRREASTPLRYVLSNDALQSAYITLIIFVMLYILFGAKRKQRVIPVMPPLQNSTVDFVETVGRLYFQQGDHKDLVDKKIRYLLEHIRHRFHLPTNDWDEEFCRKLSAKSGIKLDEINDLFTFLERLRNKKEITQKELHQCNNYIESFQAKL